MKKEKNIQDEEKKIVEVIEQKILKFQNLVL